MRISVEYADGKGRSAPGPGDLNGVASGAMIVVRGEPVRDRDFALWGGAIGAAVLRGASVRRLP